MTGDLDEIIGALHGDKQRVLKGQLQSIEEEVVERKVISAEVALGVNEELSKLRNEIINLEVPHENAVDVSRKDRMVLERERLELSKELREEQRDAWKDVQQLKREEREVEKALTTQEQDHKRVKELL